MKQWFNPESGQRLGDEQIINHFPNHGELTRKDMMVKNIKRYRKDLEKDYALLAAAGGAEPEGPGGKEAGGAGGGAEGEEDPVLAELDFVPATYTLPADYSLFVEEFRRHPASTWIMKPARGAQGSGIFLINKLSQIKKWATGGRYPAGNPAAAHTYVVSRYVDQPLLVCNKKFDLRLYVLVTGYRPLMAYIHRQGFARFCSAEYSSEAQDLDNAYMHLTNVAIQKHGEDFNANHGGKWSMTNLMLYIESTLGGEAARKLGVAIEGVIIHSLRACQNVMINDRHCFELYGYDILIDSELKPWLIEVNASPSLSTTTEIDRQCKHAVISDTLDIVAPGPSRGRKKGRKKLGGFSVLFDEAAATGAAEGGGGAAEAGGSERSGGAGSTGARLGRARPQSAGRRGVDAKRGTPRTRLVGRKKETL